MSVPLSRTGTKEFARKMSKNDKPFSIRYYDIISIDTKPLIVMDVVASN